MIPFLGGKFKVNFDNLVKSQKTTFHEAGKGFPSPAT